MGHGNTKSKFVNQHKIRNKNFLYSKCFDTYTSFFSFLFKSFPFSPAFKKRSLAPGINRRAKKKEHIEYSALIAIGNTN